MGFVKENNILCKHDVSAFAAFGRRGGVLCFASARAVVVVQSPSFSLKMKLIFLTLSAVLISAALAQSRTFPATWDPRSNATQSRCISEILNQGRCGSCYAFAAASLLSDRLCYGRGFENSPAQNKSTVSPQPLVSCPFSGRYTGCNGGRPARSWAYFAQNPTPTCTQACTAGS